MHFVPASRACVLCFGIALASQAAPPTYVPVDLGGLPGSTITFVNDLNNRNEVVGNCVYADGHFRAFLWRNGVISELPTLGGNNSRATAINNNGWIVGQSNRTHNGPERATLWRPGLPPLEIGTLGGTMSSANGINDSGVVVGQAWTTGNQAARAYKWQLGVGMMDLGVLGGSTSNNYSAADAINAVGTIVGVSDGTNGYPNPFRWTSGTMVNLAPSSVSGEALAINDAGTTVGLNRSGSLDQATIFNATPTLLGRFAGDTEGAAHDINNLGRIVGNSASPSLSRATIWITPNPAGLRDLNLQIAPGTGWQLSSASKINDNNVIVGKGRLNGVSKSFILLLRCISDYDDGTGTGRPDGGVTLDDLVYYLVLFNSGNINADISGAPNGGPDGGVTLEDLITFLVHFDAGC